MYAGSAAWRPGVARWRRGAAVALAGAVALCADADWARADTGPQGVRPGDNITVFHNIDMVATFGHQVGGQVQVDVFRGDHRIASTRGAAVDAAPDGGALEVNHGPLGAPRPGDCFDGATPDIRPGDRIVVSNPGGRAGIDEAIVDDVNFAATPVRRLWVDIASGQPVAGPAPGAREEVWVEGTASFVDPADGTRSPMPPAKLDSAGFIDLPADNQLRLGPNVVEEPGAPGTFRARYWAPFAIERNKNGRNDAYVLDALATADGHAMGYGHTAVLPPTSMLVDGFGEQSGPALGCESSPKVESSVGTLSAEALNIADSGPSAPDLVVGGWAAAGVGTAQVVLSNGAASVTAAAELSGGTGPQGWSASFTRQQLADLGDGALKAQLTVNDVPVGVARTIGRDTVAPAAPTATPGEGSYTGIQAVDLSAESGADIRYTTDGSAPTPSSSRYGGQIVLDRTTSLRAIAVDQAGNVSPPASLTFRIVPFTTGPGAGLPVPGLAVLGTSGSSGLAASAAPAASAASAVTVRVRRVSAPARLSARGARRTGLVASFVAPAGAEYAQARLYRVDGATRRLLARKVLAATAGRRETARFTSAAVRRRLTAGRYVVEVRTGPSLSRMGPAVVARVRVGR